MSNVTETPLPDTIRTDFLALDLETCAEVKVSRRGNPPKIKVSQEALRPWKGEIRLVSVADEDGNIQQYDLRGARCPQNSRSDRPAAAHYSEREF